jgi:hypothetical protein
MDVLFAQDQRITLEMFDPRIAFQRHYLKTLLYKAVMLDEHPTMDELAAAMHLRNADIYDLLSRNIALEQDGLWRLLVSTMHSVVYEGDTGRSTPVDRPPTWFLAQATGTPDHQFGKEPFKSVIEATLWDFSNQRARFRAEQLKLLTDKVTP